MFAEELAKIKDSEAKADELQREAKVSSKRMVEEAEAKANQIIEDAAGHAKDVYDALLAEGESQSNDAYDLFLTSTRSRCQEMIQKAENNKTKAINLIAERIVRSSVNR